MYAKYIKRILDFCLSLIALIILAVPMLILYIIVLIKEGKPVIFKQERPGKDEKIFVLYKFRTMLDKKDKNGILLSEKKRLTKFGQVLRATSLDELPELINILKGDMALVGPRPLLVEYLECYKEDERHRHDVRPGLTGLAQISGRNAISWEDKFKKDIEYVQNITFKNDVKIIFITLKKVFAREGINHEGNATMDNLKEIRIKKGAKLSE